MRPRAGGAAEARAGGSRGRGGRPVARRAALSAVSDSSSPALSRDPRHWRSRASEAAWAPWRPRARAETTPRRAAAPSPSFGAGTVSMAAGAGAALRAGGAGDSSDSTEDTEALRPRAGDAGVASSTEDAEGEARRPRVGASSS